MPGRAVNGSRGFGPLEGEVMGMVWKAMLCGFLATCLTASVVGAMPGGLFEH